MSDIALGSVLPLTNGGEGVDNGLPDWQPVPAFPLVDARFSTFDLDIQWLYGSGITKGCSVERFCPNDVVTRGQMAAFLDRALSLPCTSTDYFTDDATSIYQIDINRLAAAGITTGCSATTFCPNANVTRGQMAAFLVRALSLPAASTDYFSDDNGTTFEHDINALAWAGITTGCSPHQLLSQRQRHSRSDGRLPASSAGVGMRTRAHRAGRGERSARSHA